MFIALGGHSSRSLDRNPGVLRESPRLWIGHDSNEEIERVLSGFGSGLVGLAPYLFALEQVEEALGHRVVVAVPALAHRVFQIVSL